METISDVLGEQVKNVIEVAVCERRRGFKDGLQKARQIVRHEGSVTTDPEIHKCLDRILKNMEEIEFKENLESKGDNNGTEEKTSSTENGSESRTEEKSEGRASY
jgi:hypothetical protein